MAHLDTTTTRRGSAKRNAAFTLQHGEMLTTRQPEGCVPVVVSRCGTFGPRYKKGFDLLSVPMLGPFLRAQSGRRFLQATLFITAIAVFVDGLFGPQVSS